MSTQAKANPWQSSGAEHALHELGLSPADHELVSPHYTPALKRCAFKVALTDGRTIKLRVHLCEERAAENHRIRARLPKGFTGVLSRVGAVTVEPWVDGQPLHSADAGRFVEQAVHLLTALHQSQPPQQAKTDEWVAEVHSGLDLLADRGVLQASERDQLRFLASRHDPGVCNCVLIHNDFCGNNLVVDESGMLWVIDNEMICCEPVDLDLARTWYLWPEIREDWVRFQQYHAELSPSLGNPTAYPFWRLLAVTRSAVVRLKWHMPNQGQPLSMLKILLQTSPIGWNP